MQGTEQYLFCGKKTWMYMYSVHSYTCLDAYNIVGIIDNKLLTFVTSGSWVWMWGKSVMFTFNLKKEKTSKTKPQIEKTQKSKMIEKNIHTLTDWVFFPTSLHHFHFTLLTVPCFASVICLLFGNASLFSCTNLFPSS